MEKSAEDSQRTPPRSFAVGDNLDWESPFVDVQLVAELPFWMMLPPTIVTIEFEQTPFEMLITDGDFEVFVGSVTDNRRSCGYQGPQPDRFESRDDIQAMHLPIVRRKQRTTVYFHARCHDAMQQAILNSATYRVAISYFASLCEAHIPVINELVNRYRLLTYDYFAYEVSAWDIPIWHVRGGTLGHFAVPLFDYLSIDGRPKIYPKFMKTDATEEEREDFYLLELTTGDQLEGTTSASASPGEMDLLDARNLMERGDYSGAIRRTTTAIEVLVEYVLKVELSQQYDPNTVEAKLNASKTDFPGRLRQWQKLSGVALPEGIIRSIEETRTLRHEVVHEGRRLTYAERGLAQRLTDSGR
jgi:hypothetical protein